MKSLIAIPFVLSGATAFRLRGNVTTLVENNGVTSNNRTELGSPQSGAECGVHTTCKPCAAEENCIFNLRVGRCVDKADRAPHEKWAMAVDDCLEDLPKYDLEAGASCAPGYEPLTSSWEDCAMAARSMGFKGDAVNFVKYNKPWGTTRPQGCFRKGNGQFHFNDGDGGNFKGRDRILCVLEGEGPINRNRGAGSSLESDIVIDTTFEEAGPEGDAPTGHLDLDEEGNGGIIEHEIGAPPSNFTDTISTEAYKNYSEEAPVSRSVCGRTDERERIYGTTGAPWKWIVKLTMHTKTGHRKICSGFFISKRAIMTAAHCLYMHDHGGWMRFVEVCPGRNGNSLPYSCQWVYHLYVTKKWVDDHNSEYDYGTITLPDNSFYNKGIGYFGFTSSLSRVSVVNVAGYPGDKGGATLWWNYGKFNVKGRELEYMMDTAGGMSGGPVWAYYRSENQRRVVGIHVHGGCPNSAVRVDSELFKYMLDLRKNYN